jgi:hypothetical protein
MWKTLDNLEDLEKIIKEDKENINENRIMIHQLMISFNIFG